MKASYFALVGLALLCGCSGSGSSSDGSIRYVSGTVSAADGSPGAGLTVIVEGMRTVTDEKGNYQLEAPPSGGFMLEVSGNGVQTSVAVDTLAGATEDLQVDVQIQGGALSIVKACLSDSECLVGERCLFPPGDCGSLGASAPGGCFQIGLICTLEYAPVCGCDGQTYPSSCVAQSSGASIARNGECEFS